MAMLQVAGDHLMQSYRGFNAARTQRDQCINHTLKDFMQPISTDQI